METRLGCGLENEGRWFVVVGRHRVEAGASHRRPRRNLPTCHISDPRRSGPPSIPKNSHGDKPAPRWYFAITKIPASIHPNAVQALGDTSNPDDTDEDRTTPRWYFAIAQLPPSMHPDAPKVFPRGERFPSNPKDYTRRQAHTEVVFCHRQSITFDTPQRSRSIYRHEQSRRYPRP